MTLARTDTDLVPFGDDDRESVLTTRQPEGVPVDPPDESTDLHARAMRRAGERRPILPGWARSRRQAGTVVRWAAGYGLHVTAYHATRAPKYAAKVAFWAPVGLLRGTGRAIHWAFDLEGFGIRQDSATRNDAKDYLALSRQRDRRVAWRGWVLLAGGLVLLGAWIAWLFVPRWLHWSALAAVTIGLAWLGRPADRPITDRVHNGSTYRKLTAEVVRRALCSLGLAGINQAVAKDPGAITFPREIHRDGPGYLATVDLPHGVEAVDVIERRGRLASGLRLPMDQVWPEPMHGAGAHRLALWVGDQPASATRPPAWPLLRTGRVDLFGEFPFATDPRLRPVAASLMFRNWLFGGVPGSGKTFAMRVPLLAAALDPRAELHVFELKGSGDFDMFEPVCVEYGSGADDETAGAALRCLEWARRECGRRATVVKEQARRGRAPENKVTPELAGDARLGLHPLVIAVDEAQELFAHDEYGKAAGVLATQVIKLGRAFGVILLLGTQRPDKDSLPTGVSANVNSRFGLAVMDQVANDMILGTSAYRSGIRATQFRPGTDAGWGWLVGFGEPHACRSFYVDNPGAAKVIARAVQLRGGPVEVADRERVRVQARNLLSDVREVWPAGEDALWSELIVPRLVALDPEAYADLTVETFGARMRAAGVATVSIHRKLEGKGYTRAGVRREVLEAPDR